MIAGLLAMLAFDADSATALILVLLVPMGVGGGLAVPPLTAALLEALPPERAGLASGVFNAARQFGGGLGVALFGGLVATHFVDGMHVALLGRGDGRGWSASGSRCATSTRRRRSVRARRCTRRRGESARSDGKLPRDWRDQERFAMGATAWAHHAERPSPCLP